MTADVKQMTKQAGDEALLFAAANQSLDSLRNIFGPTVGCSVSRCKNGGYVIMTGNTIHAACTDAWEAKEIIGDLMMAEFQVSVTKPEDARNVSPPTKPGAADHQGERMPGFLRPVPDERTAEVERKITERMRETAKAVLVALVVGVHAVVGV